MEFKDLKVGDWFTDSFWGNEAVFIKYSEKDSFCIAVEPTNSNLLTRGLMYAFTKSAEVNLVMKIHFDFDTSEMYEATITLDPQDDDFQIGDYACIDNAIYLLKIGTQAYLAVWTPIDEEIGKIRYLSLEKVDDMHGAAIYKSDFIREEKEFI